MPFSPNTSDVFEVKAERPVVLVVDDDMAVRLMTRAAVEPSGYAIEEAEDGQSALEMFERIRPDVVLLDIMMPGLDGFATCAAVRELPSGAHTPIIMMTGLDDIESIHRAYDAGATDFVTKPINFSILNYRLRYILRAKQTADELRKSEARIENAQRIARIGHWEWNAQTDTAHCSDGTCDIFGLSSPFLRLEDFLSLVCAEDRDMVEETLRAAVQEGKGYSLEHRLLRPDGGQRIVQQQTEIHAGDDGNPLGIVGTIQDITERRHAEEKIQSLIYYDALTGLPNRSLLQAHLNHAIANAKRYERSVAIVCLDIDHFKRFNDTLGRTAGDELLQHVAERLQRCMRDSDCLSRNTVPDSGLFPSSTHGDTLARLGGDEFVVVLTELHQVEDAALVARRITEALSEPFMIENNELHLTASIGISAYPIDGNNPDTLLKYADIAMYHAKERGRNGHQFYTESINARTMRKFSIETHLRKALERGELSLHYQPKLDVYSDQIVGAEALLRWQQPDMGMVPPGEFISIAEETGLIVPLGEWVLHTACKQNEAWQAQGIAELVMSVNLSASQFRQKHLASVVSGILGDTGLDPRFLELELTESVLMDDTDKAVATLRKLKEIGLDISIDDFGTGYSSLSYLKRFPLSALKIDQSFVRDLTTDPDDAAIVTSTIALAHSLRLKVVAEGVEHPEQLDFLRTHGCDQIQGYVCSRALPAEDFAAWLKARSQSAAAANPNRELALENLS